MELARSKAGISAKKVRSPVSIAVRTGWTTRPAESAASADSMASISSVVERTARTSDSVSQRGMGPEGSEIQFGEEGIALAKALHGIAGGLILFDEVVLHTGGGRGL